MIIKIMAKKPPRRTTEHLHVCQTAGQEIYVFYMHYSFVPYTSQHRCYFLSFASQAVIIQEAK